MEEAISRGILVGRPYGGASIAWSPKLDHLITPVSNSKHKRVVAIVLKDGNRDLLLLCVYMPFYNSSQRSECIAETIDAITMLETIIEEHPDHDVIIGGDSEMIGESPFDQYWEELTSKFSLSICDSLYPTSSFTYHHESLNQKKWNDHFIVSKSLIEQGRLSEHRIIDDGDNTSDHLPIVMRLTVDRVARKPEPPSKECPSILKWEKLTDVDKSRYTQCLSDVLTLSPSPLSAVHCEGICICENTICHAKIQAEYDHLIKCFKIADQCLPRFKPGTEKDWWTDELTQLKNKSIEIHSIWKSEGSQMHGPTHAEQLRARAAYKRAQRAAQRAPKQKAWDRLHANLAEEDTNSFWQSWRKLYNKNKSHLSPVVNGCSSEGDIANCFKESFVKNSQPNNKENVRKLDEKFTDEYSDYLARHKEACDCKPVYISLLNTIDAVGCMKQRKCADNDGISAEHFVYAPLNVLIRLTGLFNRMLKHAFVPKQFRFGDLIPILKDQMGHQADTDNYRGITISPQGSKLFEHALKLVFCDALLTSPYQFGFKKRSSTTHALHCLKQTVNYYVNNGSRLFCSFLDASKAFDRLVHSGLFMKLMKRKIPLVFLRIIMSWYDGLLCRLKWGDAYSDWFAITAGVRQGGVLSPDFYSIYVDDLLDELKALDKGCYFLSLFAAAFFYADDMAIIAPSVHGLQCLLNVCTAYCDQWDICLNPKKSKNLYFGKKCEFLCDLKLDGKKIEWVDEWKYLGVTLKRGKVFNCSVSERIKKFFRCSNAIFRIEGRSNKKVMLRLVETHCVPLLTYAIEIVHVTDQNERRQLRVAYNSLFRKIFDYRWRESVTALQHSLGRPTWEELLQKRENCFKDRLSFSPPNSLAFVSMI